MWSVLPQQVSVPAQLQMGQFYLNGDQSIRDPQKAAIWFGYAAEKGSLEAYYHLGMINQELIGDIGRRFYTGLKQPLAKALHQPTSPQPDYTLQHLCQMKRVCLKQENLAKSYLWLSATQLQSQQRERTTSNCSDARKGYNKSCP